MPKKNRQRVQIYFEDDVIETIDKVKGSTGLPTNAEVLRMGIRWFEFCVDLLAEGHEIIVKNPDGTNSKLMMPFYVRQVEKPAAVAGVAR